MSRSSSVTTTKRTSPARKLAAKCRQACRSDRLQITSDMTGTFESVEKHEDSGTQLLLGRPPESQKDFNTILPRTMLTRTVTPDYENTRPPHPSRQHPVHKPGQGRQHKDQAWYEPLSDREEMMAHPPSSTAANHEGWTPWSSKDVYTPNTELNHDPRCFVRKHSEGETLLQLRSEPFDVNLPAYYDPGHLLPPSYHVSQKTADSAIDMPMRKAHPFILNTTALNHPTPPPTPPPRNPKRLMMSKTPHPKTFEEDLPSTMHHESFDESIGSTQSGSARKSAINIIRLRPHPSRPERISSLASQVVPSPLGSHPNTMRDTGEFPMPPLPPKHARRSPPAPKVKPNPKDRPFDVDPADQHKTNVRRPPKGIQHWFDAYISSDDDDEGEDEDDVDSEELEPEAQSEPQELPAEDVLRPTYAVPERGPSLGTEESTRITTSSPTNPGIPCITTPHSPVGSDSSNSIQSSHCRGRTRKLGPSRRFAATNFAQESVLSLSSTSSEYSDSDSDDQLRLPAIRDSIRDSILDDRNFEVASAASIRVQRLSPTETLNAARGGKFDSKRSTDDSQNLNSFASTPFTQMQHPSLLLEPCEESGNVDATLRRLNGSSSAKHSTNSTTPSASDAAHVVAVTDEEMMFLEMMRKKRAELQQVSFTEGFSVALQAEQQRLAKRTVSAPKAAMKVLQQRERNDKERHEQIMHDQERKPSEVASPGAETSASEMQRQLDDIRRAQVDERFQIERFLGMSSPNQRSCTTPAPSRPNEDLLLPATVYSPIGAAPKQPLLHGDQTRSNDRTEVQRRVEEFIASQGAVPPLNNIRTMRRPSHQALSPTRVIEQAMPPIAPLRKTRTGSSGGDPYTLKHQVSVIHHSQAGMQRTSPVSAVPSNSSLTQNFRLSPTGPYPGNVYAERPRTASAPVNNRQVRTRRSLPRINTNEALITQQSTLDDVRDGWQDLGGRGLTSPGTTIRRVQT